MGNKSNVEEQLLSHFFVLVNPCTHGDNIAFLHEVFFAFGCNGDGDSDDTDGFQNDLFIACFGWRGQRLELSGPHGHALCPNVLEDKTQIIYLENSEDKKEGI